MKSISFTIPGVPYGKGRPRVTTIAGHAQMYPPKETVNYENLVKLYFTKKKLEIGLEDLLIGPIAISILAYFPIPKSARKKDLPYLATEEAPYIGKPDADNIAKIICDSLNWNAYKDDSSIFTLRVSKFYSENPRVYVVIEEYDPLIF